MADSDHEVPPIPVPPVEPTPKTPRAKKPATPVESAEVLPPLVDLTGTGDAAPNPYVQSNPYVQPNPYAAPAAPAAYPQQAPAQPGAYPAAPQAYVAQPYAAGPPSGLAITSMVLGIAGFVLNGAALGFLPGVAAIVTGHLAQKRQPHAKGFWLTGLITGYVAAAFGALVGGLFIAGMLISFTSY